MAQATAKTALGAKFYTVASGGALVARGSLISITPNKITRETIDATDLDVTGGKEFLAAGLYDGGEVSLSAYYVAGSTDDTHFAGAAKAGTLLDCKIEVKTAASTAGITFSGYITSYGPDELTVDGKQTYSMTIKITGDVAQA